MHPARAHGMFLFLETVYKNNQSELRNASKVSIFSNKPKKVKFRGVYKRLQTQNI